jgi:hypothetical protein
LQWTILINIQPQHRACHDFSWGIHVIRIMWPLWFNKVEGEDRGTLLSPSSPFYIIISPSSTFSHPFTPFRVSPTPFLSVPHKIKYLLTYKCTW